MQNSRYFANSSPDKEDASVNVESEKTWIVDLIQNYVTQILHQDTPHDASPDLYTGDAGIAFMFLRLLDCKFIPADEWKCLEHAREFINRSLGHRKATRYPDALLCGAAGINAVAIAVSLRDDPSSVQKHLDRFDLGFPESLSNDWDEVLVGRAGFVGACNYLNEVSVPPLFKNDIRLKRIADQILNRGVLNAKDVKTHFPLMYSYHGTAYLGAAHGIVGILHALLQLWFGENRLIDEVPQSQLDLVWKSIDALLELQFPDGNFPTDMGSLKGKRLLHWCHGAPGVLPLLVKAHRVSNDPRYLQSAQLAADLIWRQGLLRKGPGICHGVAGNAYSFLIMFRQTCETKYWYRALAFARFLVNDQFRREARISDRPLSLYEGLAGTVCFLCDLLEPHRAAFPFMSVI